MLEREIEKKVCDYAREKGFEVYKFTSPSRVGVPDRMFIGFPQRVFWIEFKREGGEPTPVQIREMQKIAGRGFSVYLVDNVEDGKKIIDEEKATCDAGAQVIQTIIGNSQNAPVH